MKLPGQNVLLQSAAFSTAHLKPAEKIPHAVVHVTPYVLLRMDRTYQNEPMRLSALGQFQPRRMITEINAPDPDVRST